MQRDTIQAASSFAQRNQIPVRLQEQMVAHLCLKYRADSEGLQQQEILDMLPKAIRSNQSIVQFVMNSVLRCIGLVDVSSDTYLLHHGLLNFMLVAMSTQLLSRPSPGPDDSHPFTDATMVQKKDVINLVVRSLLLNYIAQP